MGEKAHNRSQVNIHPRHFIGKKKLSGMQNLHHLVYVCMCDS